MGPVLSRVFTRKEQFAVLAASASICLGSVVIVARHLWRAPETPPLPMAVVEPQAPAPRPSGPASDATIVELPSPTEHAPSPATSVPGALSSVTVSIRGAVDSPGVYEIAAGGRVRDLLARAGGPATEADLSDINLAARLLDGTTLHIPRRATGTISDGRLVVRGGTAPVTVNLPQYTISGWRPAEPGGEEQGDDGAPRRTGGGAGPVNVNTASLAELDALPGVGPVTAAAIVDHRREQPFRTVEDLIRVKGIGPKKMAVLRPLVTVGP